MTSGAITIEGRYNLLALHRGLMEARYCPAANDFDVSGSPLLAKIHRDVVAALICAESEEGRNPAPWLEWLQLDVGRREWGVAVGRARDSSLWDGLSTESRKEFVRDLLSPFEIGDELIDRFAREVDGRTET